MPDSYNLPKRRVPTKIKQCYNRWWGLFSGSSSHPDQGVLPSQNNLLLCIFSLDQIFSFLWPWDWFQADWASVSPVSSDMYKARNRKSLAYPACSWRLIEGRLGGKRGPHDFTGLTRVFGLIHLSCERKHHFLESPRHLHGVTMDPRSFTLKASQEMLQTSWLWISLILYVTWIPMV